MWEKAGLDTTWDGVLGMEAKSQFQTRCKGDLFMGRRSYRKSGFGGSLAETGETLEFKIFSRRMEIVL